MNVVYIIENKSKTEGPRFYIGSKQECELIEIDGVPTIFDTHLDKAYWGSSANPIYWQDMQRGDRFEASILKIVKHRRDLITEERLLHVQHGIPENEDFYNLAVASVHPYHANPERIINPYGESLKVLAKNRSSISKRDGRAKKLGFKNYGLLYI